MITTDPDVCGARVQAQTQIPEGQQGGGAVSFRGPFVKSLLNFINENGMPYTFSEIKLSC